MLQFVLLLSTHLSMSFLKKWQTMKWMTQEIFCKFDCLIKPSSVLSKESGKDRLLINRLKYKIYARVHAFSFINNAFFQLNLIVVA